MPLAPQPARRLCADWALLPGGWAPQVLLAIDGDGYLRQVSPGDGGDAERLPGWVLPGMANLHSHAFQRALAGRTEHTLRGQADSFWTWRSAMYALAAELGPEALEAVALQLYREMLACGFTSVGEFHYLHHAPGGARYADPRELSLRILAAAEAAGIALTHLPVLYLHGGFGAPPLERQRRFVHRDADDYLRLLDSLRPLFPGTGRHRLGLAPHSLRAVDGAALAQAVAGARALDPEIRMHIHVAEQEQEVAEALAHLGRRPVRYLLEQLPLGPRDCLVHATHLDQEERRALAASGAVAGLCPTTEADLGDGLFPAPAYVAEGGRWGIGTDSHVRVSVTEELRWLEWGQRLQARRRHLILGPGEQGSSVRLGVELYQQAARSGAQALGQPAGALEVGRRADLVLLDPAHPRLAGHDADTVLEAWIFGGADGAVREVYVAGRRVYEAF